ncbi:MAG: hypothetical protein EXS46_03695 [Candidatus Taylorbacteria bacterium]|nr:hypothetical protein [Candidatus Taylorbacteria bacterium]
MHLNNVKHGYLIFGLLIGFVAGATVLFSLRTISTDSVKTGEVVADIINNVPDLTQDQLDGKTELSSKQKNEVLSYRNAIILRASSQVPLTSVERKIVGDILIEKSVINEFSLEEVSLIAKAFDQRKPTEEELLIYNTNLSKIATSSALKK